MNMNPKQRALFDGLFVLEIANNHWGNFRRGIEIIDRFAEVVEKHQVKAAFKLQIRDVPNFIHKSFRHAGASKSLVSLTKKERYIQKTDRTRLSDREIGQLVEHIRSKGCMALATPFDEQSVDMCVQLDLPIIKVASADVKANDWSLLQKIASTSKPVIFSSGGCSDEDLDKTVDFFQEAGVPFAINHCVSKYPSEDDELELNQIDYLRQRYPGIPIGFSTHEYGDWYSSVMISYAKGARLWERHVDIPYPKGHQQQAVSKYCSLPEQIDTFFKAFRKVRTMCGGDGSVRREISTDESKYLCSLHRGLYFLRNMSKGKFVTPADLYAAIPWQGENGQLTTSDIENYQVRLNCDVSKDAPLLRQNCHITRDSDKH